MDRVVEICSNVPEPEPPQVLSAWAQQFPLRAYGRNIVNRTGERYKFAGINWYGASDELHVVGGLADRSLAGICGAVASMGFTVVRLPFSNQMLRKETEVGKGAIDFTLNPQLRGLSPLEVLDEVVFALGKYRVAVVLNNHTTLGAWSGGVEKNGLWFLDQEAAASGKAGEAEEEERGGGEKEGTATGEKAAAEGSVARRASAEAGGVTNPSPTGERPRPQPRPQSGRYTEAAWVGDWLMLATRYRDCPWVAGYDLRNEVRPPQLFPPSHWPHWGSSSSAPSTTQPSRLLPSWFPSSSQGGGGEADWRRASGRCARALVSSGAQGLIVIERLAWPQDGLASMLTPSPPWDPTASPSPPPPAPPPPPPASLPSAGKPEDTTGGDSGGSGRREERGGNFLASGGADEDAFAGVPRSRIVLGVHCYAWSGPGHWSPKQFTSGALKLLLQARDWASGLSLYGEMTAMPPPELSIPFPAAASSSTSASSCLETQLEAEFGWVLDQGVCPVWLSEFGGDANNAMDMEWFHRVCSWLEKKDADFAYWSLNVGPKPQAQGQSGGGGGGGGGEDEAYGLLTNDWRPRWHDKRLRLLRRLTLTAPTPPRPQPPTPLSTTMRATTKATAMFLHRDSDDSGDEDDDEYTEDSAEDSDDDSDDHDGDEDDDEEHDNEYYNRGDKNGTDFRNEDGAQPTAMRMLPRMKLPVPGGEPLLLQGLEAGPPIDWPVRLSLAAFQGCAPRFSGGGGGGQSSSSGSSGGGSIGLSSGSSGGGRSSSSVLTRDAVCGRIYHCDDDNGGAVVGNEDEEAGEDEEGEGWWCSPLPGPLVPFSENKSHKHNGKRQPPQKEQEEEEGGRHPRSRRGRRRLRSGSKRLPSPRFAWTVLPGCDADPGLDADVVEVASLAYHGLANDVEVLKRSCVLGGFGGFALREGVAYFRASSASSLRTRVQSGHPGTVLFVPQEVRLCRVLERIETPPPCTPTSPLRDAAAAAAAAEEEREEPATRTRLQHRPKLVCVAVDLDEFRGKDAFTGADAKTVESFGFLPAAT